VRKGYKKGKRKLARRATGKGREGDFGNI